MGMHFYLAVGSEDDVEFPDSIFDFGVTYGTASSVLEAIGRPGGLVREDGEWDYVVSFDPTFLAGACERAIADNRADYNREMKARLAGTWSGAGRWVYVRQLLELAEHGVVVGARAVQGS